jgi:hypothetical protein
LLLDAPPEARGEYAVWLDEIEAQLRTAQPDKDVVRQRWQQIATHVGVLREPVMVITKLVAKFL